MWKNDYTDPTNWKIIMWICLLSLTANANNHQWSIFICFVITQVRIYLSQNHRLRWVGSNPKNHWVQLLATHRTTQNPNLCLQAVSKSSSILGHRAGFPSSSGAEPFPRSHLAFPWCSSMPFPWALSLSPESKAQHYSSAPCVELQVPTISPPSLLRSGPNKPRDLSCSLYVLPSRLLTIPIALLWTFSNILCPSNMVAPSAWGKVPPAQSTVGQSLPAWQQCWAWCTQSYSFSGAALQQTYRVLIKIWFLLIIFCWFWYRWWLLEPDANIHVLKQLFPDKHSWPLPLNGFIARGDQIDILVFQKRCKD